MWEKEAILKDYRNNNVATINDENNPTIKNLEESIDGYLKEIEELLKNLPLKD
jgi:hypothetical protein